MTRIKYQFATAAGSVFGQVQAEKLPFSSDTNNLDITVSTYNLATHTETRGDGPARSFTYSGYNLSTSKDFKGNVTTYGYDAKGFRNSVKNALNQITTYVHEPVCGQITKITHPDGTFSTIGYTDAANPYWINKTTDELGRITTYTRDANHRVTAISFPDGRSEVFTYNGFGQVLTHRMNNGQTESFAYNASGLLLTQTNPLNQVTTFTYDSKYRVASVADALNNVTSFLYTESGKLLRTTYPGGAYVETTYNIMDMPTSTRNELGQISYTNYDRYYRLASTTDPLGHVTTTSYVKPGSTSPYDHTTSDAYLITSPTGRQMATTYDQNFQPLTVTSGYGSSDPSTSSMAYDVLGRAITATDALGNISSTSYDNRGRKLTATDALNHVTTWSYDAVSNVLTTKLADNTITTNTYDAMNRVLTTTDPLNQTVTMDYDLAGNVNSLTDKRGKVYSYLYDALNRQTQMTYPDTSYEASTYDDNGTLDSYRNRSGNLETYTYDARQRLTHSTWDSNGDTVDLAYDDAGKTIDVNGNNSDLHYTYDAAGHQLSETQTIVGLSAKTVAYTYDDDGNRITTTYPNGTVLNYTWSPRQELQNIRQGANTLVSYTYDDRGGVTNRSLFSGNTSEYIYNAVGSLDLLSHKRGTTTLASYDYGYNAVNNRTYVKREDGLGDAYNYDATQQLSSVKYNAQAVDSAPSAWTAAATYNYDAAGNRTSYIPNSTTIPYATADNNTYSAAGALTLDYDNNRNVKIWNGWTYAHDAENKLTSAIGNGVTASFARDPSARISKSVINGVTIYNVYDGWNIILRYNASGAQIDQNIYGGGTDEIVTRMVGSTSWYYQYDGLGSVSHVYDVTGNLAESYNYDAYGAVTIESPSGAVLLASAISNRYFFTGREYLKELNLYDYRNRNYRADLGRFLEPDPMGFAAGDDNMYRYCGNNPTNFRDPSGKFFWVFFGGVAGAGIDLAVQYHMNNGDWSKVNGWEVLASGISGTMGGGLGVGIGKLATQYSLSLGWKVALGAVGSDAIGAATQPVANVGTEKAWNDGMVKAAAINGIFGAGGTLMSEGSIPFLVALQNRSKPFTTASISNAYVGYTGKPISTEIVGAVSNSAGTVVSNLSPAVSLIGHSPSHVRHAGGTRGGGHGNYWLVSAGLYSNNIGSNNTGTLGLSGTPTGGTYPGPNGADRIQGLDYSEY